VTTGKHRPPGRAALPILWLVVILAVAAGATAFLTPLGDRLFGQSTPAPGPGSPTPYPTGDAPKVTAPPRGELLVHGTGDVNMDPSYIPNLAANGYDYAWSGLDGLFQRDDLTIINLECAVSDLGSAVPKEFNFRGDPASLPVLRRNGIEVANLGNNHSMDYGKDAMLDARKNLIAADIAPVGVGQNAAQAHRPAILEINGWRIAVLGFGGVVPSPDWVATADSPGMADGDDIPSMVAAVKAADEQADLVFVSIHWGVELDTTPRAEDEERARAMIDAGADAIFGHHSHRLNPMGTYKGRPIFWGLGNFVWPAHSYDGSVTAVAEVHVSPAGKVTGKLLPAFIEASGHPVLQ
jgi:poly-gamma-glutamate synthesis protein (capsule biosynthesis protein)